MLIDGSILDNSRRSVSSAVMNITLVSGRIALIFLQVHIHSFYTFLYQLKPNQFGHSYFENIVAPVMGQQTHKP